MRSGGVALVMLQQLQSIPLLGIHRQLSRICLILSKKYFVRFLNLSCAIRGIFGKSVAAMNKAELIEAVQKAMGKEATKRAAEDAVNTVLDAIAAGIKKTKKVQLIGFGTFSVKKRAARMGRNPKTGESMKIAASKSVGFKASSSLKTGL
jgi:DNA-binding protein HU-beta